jgi:hypothetical protein
MQPSSRVNKKRSASYIDLDTEDVVPSKRRRGRPPKSGNTEKNASESASNGPRLSKKPSVSKLPRIPAVKNKPTPPSQNTPNKSSRGKVSTLKPTPYSVSRIPLKEKLPNIAFPATNAGVEDSSSETDLGFVVETLDKDAGSLEVGPLFGDEDVPMAETISTENQPVAGPSVSTASASISSKVPAHRAREANPRVKMMDDEFTAHSGLSVKAALSTGFANLSNGGQKPKPKHYLSVLPHRARQDSSTIFGSSSLLTAGKDGALITVRKHVPAVVTSAEQHDLEVPSSVPPVVSAERDETILVETVDHSVPTAEEVLRLAGMESTSANALPDYDDTTDRDAEGESHHENDFDLLVSSEVATMEYSASLLPSEVTTNPLSEDQGQSSQISVAIGLEIAEQ